MHCMYHIVGPILFDRPFRESMTIHTYYLDIKEEFDQYFISILIDYDLTLA